MSRATIIGLGLIGGSIGLALKKARIPGMEIMGLDSDPKATQQALKMGAVDKVGRTLDDVMPNAGLVILATPLSIIKDVLEVLPPYLAANAVVTDTGSSKVTVMEWAEKHLPASVSFVGGHPMAGKEESGIKAAEADLFVGRRYCIVPGKGASEEAVKTVVDMAVAVGATPYFMDAAEHDSYVAAVSHVPLLLSYALVSSTSQSPVWREMSKVASTGFRDVSRLASGDPALGRDICLTNRESILRWTDAMVTELQRLRHLVEEGKEEELAQVFAKAREAREKWLYEFTAGVEAPSAESPKQGSGGIGERMSDFFLGRRIAERYGKLFRSGERKDKGPEKGSKE